MDYYGTMRGYTKTQRYVAKTTQKVAVPLLEFVLWFTKTIRYPIHYWTLPMPCFTGKNTTIPMLGITPLQNTLTTQYYALPLPYRAQRYHALLMRNFTLSYRYITQKHLTMTKLHHTETLRRNTIPKQNSALLNIAIT